MLQSKKSFLPLAILTIVLVLFVLVNHRELPTLFNLKSSPERDFNRLTDWANSIQSVVHNDVNRETLLWSEIPSTADLNFVREYLYRFINHPLQGVCKVGKFFGGRWLGGMGCLDGHKYVCLDDFFIDVVNQKCLIYSFGINNEWSFEENMIDIGCTIRSFDPTIDGSSMPRSPLISFRRIGLADKSGDLNIGKVVPLTDSINMMGDVGKNITYLKVDIEGSEINAMKNWVESGVLKYVRQIGIEVHTVHDINGKDFLLNLIESFRSFYQQGFKLISVTNNECVGKSQDLNKQYYNLFELVFHKPSFH